MSRLWRFPDIHCIVLKQDKENYQRASFAKFSDCVEANGHHLRRVSLGHKIVDDGSKDRLDCIGRDELVSCL